MSGKEMITVAAYASAEFIEKKSRFIGHIAPACDEKEAQQFLERIRAEHKAANHNCYAWVCGENDSQQRSSDMGAPSGTAGRPILEAIKRADLHNTVVVVTRYFGGILLGAGGLVRAYTKGCAIALDAAQVSVMEMTCRVLFDVPYPLWDKFNYALQSLPVLLENADYQASVDATLLIRERDRDEVCRKLISLTDGKTEYLQLDELFYPWPE